MSAARNGSEEVSAPGRVLFPLLALCAAVRMIAWAWVAQNHMPPLADEQFYWQLSRAYASGDLQKAYGFGIWPPLHQLILSLFPSPEAGRLTGVLYGTLTLVPVFFLADKWGGRRAAILACLSFTLYPVFVSYSHFLWSESLFAMILCFSIWLLAGLLDSGGVKRAILVGASLGLLGLVRSAAVPYLLLAILFLLLARQWRNAALVPAICLVIWLPWLSALHAREGRFVLLATGNGYNLYLGNNPDVPEGASSSLGDPLPAARHLAMEAGIQGALLYQVIGQTDQVAQREAIEYIEDDPGLFLARSFERLIDLWKPDTFVPRHVELGVYPKSGWMPSILRLNVIGHFVLLIFGALGLCLMKRGRAILLGTLIAGSLSPMVSVATTRFNVPSLMLLTVPAGIGLSLLVDAILHLQRADTAG